METIKLICIGCPMGCPLEVERDGDAVTAVRGNTCPGAMPTPARRSPIPPAL